jgi:predicted  nucleic acid-binding Zn-ribbon protein
MTKGADLYRLQCLDSEGDSKQSRLAEVETVLGESEPLKQAHRALEATQSQVQRWTLRHRDLELRIQGVADKTSRSEQRLYSGVVTNPKELSDIQSEVASLRRRRQKLEDDLLETMIELEEAETAHAQAQKRLDETQARWTAQRTDLTAEREMLQRRLAEIEQARVKPLNSIAANDLATYQALRRGKGGLAVVQVRDDACGGCGVAITSSLKWQLRQDGLGYCSNCGRIIVRI